MRFLVLVAAAAVAGAATVVSLKTLLPQHDASLATARAAGMSLTQFRLSDFNPLQWAYNRVVSEIASPSPNAGLNLQSAPVVVGEIKMPQLVGIKPLDLGGGSAPRHSLQPHGAIARCSRGGAMIPCN
jgi:hypothetical protein